MSDADPSVEPLMIGVVESARVLGCGRTTIYDLISAGRLHPVKIGRRTLLTMRELRALVDQLADQASRRSLE